MIGGLGKQNIHFEKERCILNRNNNIKCDKCLAACPHNAIDISSGKIEFNESNCQNCGACRSVCPTEAFTVNSLTFVSEICSSAVDDLPLGCSLNNANTRDFNVNCYALLTEGELLYLLSKKKRLIFCTEYCTRCQYVNGFNSFLSHVIMVNRMLKDNCRITLSSGDTGYVGVGRREFLGWLRHQMSTAVAGILPGRAEDPNFNIPKRRLTFIVGIKSLLGELKETTFVKELNARDFCSGCGGCAKVCPSKALALDSDTLGWDAQSCMNCELCSVTCPEKALFFGRYLSPRELFVKKTLIEYSGKRCNSCGTFITDGAKLCERCSSKTKLDLFSTG